jgi:hypothetical protein
MSEQVLEQTAEPVVQAPIEDLVTRASKVVVQAQPEKVEVNPQDAVKLDQASIDKIADPVLKASVQEAYKSMQADYTRKTQEVANKRKEAEALKAQVEQEKYNIPNLLNDPKWVQVASEYQKTIKPQPSVTANGDLTEEEYSYLAPEQQKLYLKTKQIEQGHQFLVSQMQSERVQAQDTALKSKYANYSPDIVESATKQMSQLDPVSIREYIFKASDYEKAVARAYELGKQDRKLETADKIAGSTQPSGVNVTSSGDAPVRIPNESGVEYFKRIAAHNYQKLRGK